MKTKSKLTSLEEIYLDHLAFFGTDEHFRSIFKQSRQAKNSMLYRLRKKLGTDKLLEYATKYGLD